MLFVLYALVIGAGDARTASGSDAGGKLATVVVMADQGTLVPDVGYWAEAEDPDGEFHPLWNTTAVGDRWVQATSLPFVVAAVPLYRLAGPAGALLLPVLGGMLAAVAARHLSRRLHGGDGWAAFWLIGAAGPALFYAGDFWEHGPALGLALLAIALALDDESSAPRALLTGLAAGLAVLMRAEMLLYGVVFVVATLAVGTERRRMLGNRRSLALILVGAATPVLANALVERVLLSHGVRDGRAAESLAGSGTDATSRATDAVLTTVGLFSDDRAPALMLGLLLAVALLVVGAHLRSPRVVTERMAAVAIVVAVSLYAIRFSSGPGFAPGFLAVAPLAAVGIFSARSPKERVVLATALGALPLVWMTAWIGNHQSQWGGRYVLLSGALLTVLAIGRIQEVGWRRPAAAAMVGCAVAMSAIGVVWHVERTRTIADAVTAIEDLPADVVVISDLEHLGRQGGAWYGEHRWLRTARLGAVAPAAEVARASGAQELAVVRLATSGEEEPAAPRLAGYRSVGVPELVYLPAGQRLTVQRYELG